MKSFAYLYHVGHDHGVIAIHDRESRDKGGNLYVIDMQLPPGIYDAYLVEDSPRGTPDRIEFIYGDGGMSAEVIGPWE